jgi:hypothetical protein
MMGKGRFPRMESIEPMIMKVLNMSDSPMTLLSVNYHVNGMAGKTVNLKAVKSSLAFLVESRKVSERLDKENGMTYYKALA